MNRWIIYGIRLEDSLEYRYVGKSTSDLKRFDKHITDATKGVSSAKYDWMRKHVNDAIVCEALEICPSNDLPYLSFAEKYWILSLKEFGHRLLNHTKGGDGGPTRLGMKTPETVKQKQIESGKGRIWTNQARHNASEGAKKRPRLCCMLCKGEFTLGRNYSRHWQQMHDPETLAAREQHFIEKTLKRSEERLSKTPMDVVTVSCLQCRESFSYVGYARHALNQHNLVVPTINPRRRKTSHELPMTLMCTFSSD